MQTLIFPPGPKMILPGSAYIRFRRDPIRFLTSLACDYGDIAHWRIGSQHLYLLNDAETIKDVLVTKLAGAPGARPPGRVAALDHPAAQI